MPRGSAVMLKVINPTGAAARTCYKTALCRTARQEPADSPDDVDQAGVARFK